MDTVRILYLRDAADVYGSGLRYATEGSVGLDLRACFQEESVEILPGERFGVPSGICIEITVPGVAGFVYSRSGLGAVRGLTVAQGVGVIDPDYRGELVLWLLNTSGEPIQINRGDRVAQLVFQPFVRLNLVATDSLSSTSRGSGGFGHTGKR